MDKTPSMQTGSGVCHGIPIKFGTREECYISVCAGGAAAFIYVPPSLQTYEMCLRAVMDDPSMINRVRPGLMSDEIRSICAQKK